MKRAVSVSIGSSKRDKAVEVKLFGETVRIERIGTDGDLEKATRLYTELDGQVDAIGVGGGVLGLMVGEKWYTMHSLMPLVRGVKRTPLVDGTGLKMTLERRAVASMERRLPGRIQNKTAMVTSALDRWGMAQGALDAGYQVAYGDLVFALGVPLMLHSVASLKLMARLLLPVISRLPFRWVYPLGESQEHRKPTGVQYFQQADLILGDCHYIWRYMPDRMDGKILITNTTTPEDVEIFRRAGVSYLVTSTPVYDGRSFGTNAMEAAIIATCGRKDKVDYANPGDYFQWMENRLDELGMDVNIQELCG
jgi:hypothetical protein